jgi:hypothetical protein
MPTDKVSFVLTRRGRAKGGKTVGWKVTIYPREELGGAGGVAPVAHQVAHDGEEGDDVDARAGQLVVGDVADLFLSMYLAHCMTLCSV